MKLNHLLLKKKQISFYKKRLWKIRILPKFIKEIAD